MSAGIDLDNVCCDFGNFRAVDNVNVSIQPGEFFSFLGPSGCGKTTILRMISGFTDPTGGAIRIGGKDVKGQRPNQRPTALIFQNLALFPLMPVWENIAFGLEVRGVDKATRRKKAEELLALVDLPGSADKMVSQLSGGQKQRVAIARALAASPAVLFMDEPLAALDAARKAEVMPYLEGLQRGLDIPVIYVSHAQDEVARLASHLVLLREGRVEASGTTAELLARLDLPLAHGDGAATVVVGTVESHDGHDHLTTMAFAGGRLHFASARARAPGQPIRLRVQARDVSLALSAPQGSSILNAVAVRITALQPDGPGQVMVALEAAGTPLLARITQRSAHHLGLAVGQALLAQVKGVAVLD